MRAIDGALMQGEDGDVIVGVKRYPDNNGQYGASLEVDGQWQGTYYGKTATAALEHLECSLGSLAVTLVRVRGKEQELRKNQEPPKSTRVDDVLDAGRDLRKEEVWVCFGEHSKARELVMPFKDASNLRALLESMDLRQRDQS